MIDLNFNYPFVEGQEELVQRYMAAVSSDVSLDLAAPRPYFGDPRDVESIATGLFPVTLDESRLAITCGGQAALAAAIAITSSRPGTRIATDPWTFPQFIHALPMYGATAVAVEMDDAGVIPEALIQACERGSIDSLYVMPNFHNPLGIVMPTARREAIAEIASRYKLMIIEDEAYGFLESGSQPTFLSLVPERTLQVFSLSKMISPALRLGALVVPESLASKAAECLRFAGSPAHPAATAAAARMIRDGHLPNLVSGKRREGAMRLALAKSILGERATAAHPHSWHLWMQTPKQMPSSLFAERARLESNIALTPGQAYRVDGHEQAMMRVALGGERDRNVLADGLKRLAELLT